MGQPRSKLHSLLKTLGAEEVWFVAPSADKMNFPAIVYNVDNEDTHHADDVPFIQTDRYQVTLMTRDPDDGLRRKISALPLCAFSRYFVADGLHHYVYTLYY